MSNPRTVLAGLLALIAIECLIGSFAHRSTAEIERAAMGRESERELDPAERAFALHVLANRNDPVIFGAEDLRALLESGDPLLREFAMTYDFSRADGMPLQRELEETQPEEVRMNFFMRHQKLPMHRKKVTVYFGAPGD